MRLTGFLFDADADPGFQTSTTVYNYKMCDKNGAGSFLEYLLHFLSARRNVVLPVCIPKVFVKINKIKI
jgi:hypothetical protein